MNFLKNQWNKLTDKNKKWLKCVSVGIIGILLYEYIKWLIWG